MLPPLVQQSKARTSGLAATSVSDWPLRRGSTLGPKLACSTLKVRWKSCKGSTCEGSTDEGSIGVHQRSLACITAREAGLWSFPTGCAPTETLRLAM